MCPIDTTTIKQLPVSERLSAIEDIWDSIASDAEQLDMPQWHREVLRKRLAAYRANPTEGDSWSEVRQRIERSRESKP
jgi:putative addiction module component (TIGR02574 family)